MKKPRICAVISNKDLAAITEIEHFVELFEVRIDLIGDGWPEVARGLNKPWIATNRLVQEGGNWRQSEARRKEELLKALRLGASIVDIELESRNLEKTVGLIKKTAKCLISSHNLENTPPLDRLKEIVARQQAAGADICKVITTARRFDDNATILQLFSEFPERPMIAFAMGPPGLISRILCPLVGGQFTYASSQKGAESAAGQPTVAELARLYQRMST